MHYSFFFFGAQNDFVVLIYLTLFCLIKNTIIHAGVQDDRHYSIYGIILVNTFFPEIEGGAPGNYVGRDLAIRLNEDTIKDATPNDFLVYHMHQHCDAEVLLFPGMQLHVNAEYYDVHPQNYMQNPEGLLTTNYIPPNENVFVMGAHEDGPRSIRLPCKCRWTDAK